MGDDEELQALIRDHLILPYLFGDFHPSHIQEYAGGLLIALEKPANPDGSPGGLRPIICGESWRRCLANLAAAAIRGPISKIFTSTYEIFLQTAGLQDGASHCAKILSTMYTPNAASGWRIHCGVEVTELSTNKQHTLSHSTLTPLTLT
jgi:hypothetical protein